MNEGIDREEGGKNETGKESTKNEKIDSFTIPS